MAQTTGTAGVLAGGGAVATGRAGAVAAVGGRVAIPLSAGAGAGGGAWLRYRWDGYWGRVGAAAAESGGDAMMSERPADAGDCQVEPIPDDVRAEYKLDPFTSVMRARRQRRAWRPTSPRTSRSDALAMWCSTWARRCRVRARRCNFIMMAQTEKTVETPEYRSRGDLDERARGFGNNPGLCAEENVMRDTMTDRWRGESICVHEYARVTHCYVWSEVDPMFDSKVDAAFQNATRTEGKYRNTYADDTAMEYFAEGVQNWYNTNLESRKMRSR